MQPTLNRSGPYLIVESTKDPSQSAHIGSIFCQRAQLRGVRSRRQACRIRDAAGQRQRAVRRDQLGVGVHLVSRRQRRILPRARQNTHGRCRRVLRRGWLRSARRDAQESTWRPSRTVTSSRSATHLPAATARVCIFRSHPLSPTPIGRGAFGYEFKAVSVGGFSGFLGSLTEGNATPLTTGWLVLWRRDGLDFLLSGRGVTSDQILTAATSASLASPDEWAHLLGSRATSRRTTPSPTGTAPPAAPVDTEPAVRRCASRSSPITVTVDDVSNTEQQWSGVLPTGQPWSAKVTRVYDHIEMRSYSSDGNPC